MLPALIAGVASSSLQLLCTKYRRRDVEDIFTGRDLAANSSKDNDMLQRCLRESKNPRAFEGYLRSKTTF